MGFYSNKIWGKGLIAWLLCKIVVLKLSELPGGLAPPPEVLILLVQGEGCKFAFSTSPPLILTLLIQGPHYENHYFKINCFLFF